MIDGTGLNILQQGRQSLRAFGGVNETYSCGEAEWSTAMNFSSRGYPALQTRPARKVVKQLSGVNGMYHLNGMVICRGTTLEYTKDDEPNGTGQMPGAVSDSKKVMVGMGSKVLIWPDKKAFDTETGTLTSLGAKWAAGDTTVTISRCDAEGDSYGQADVGTTEPESPTDGQKFLKYTYDDDSIVAEQYSEKAKKWKVVALDAVRIECPGIGNTFAEGDTVTLSGIQQSICDAMGETLNGEVTVRALDGDALIVDAEKKNQTLWECGQYEVKKDGYTKRSYELKLKLDGDKEVIPGYFIPNITVAWVGNSATVSEKGAVVIERRIPELDFVTEQGNRVWGCSRKENSIYACALGDPTNWYSYQGTAADSYAVNVGSDGEFTGAASCMGYILFFKENCIHKLYGTKPSDYQMSSVRCRGVAKNAEKSLSVIAETLYYLSADGVMAWDGSLPTKVSGVLDSGKMIGIDRAVGGGLDAKYYLYLHKKTGSGRLLVYDTEKGLWYDETPAGTEMVSAGSQLYLWDGSRLLACAPERESNGYTEESAAFEAVTGDIGLTTPDDKYISRVTLRVDATSANAAVTVGVSYDGGDFETLGSCTAQRDRQRFDLPFVPRRHDTMRLKLSGKGQICLRSISFTIAAGSGGRVNGALVRK